MPASTPSHAESPDPAQYPLMPYVFAREAFDLWAIAYGAWFGAAARLSCVGLDLCRTVTAARLAAAGVEQPLLNDA